MAAKLLEEPVTQWFSRSQCSASTKKAGEHSSCHRTQIAVETLQIARLYLGYKQVGAWLRKVGSNIKNARAYHHQLVRLSIAATATDFRNAKLAKAKYSKSCTFQLSSYESQTLGTSRSVHVSTQTQRSESELVEDELANDISESSGKVSWISCLASRPMMACTPLVKLTESFA